MSLSQPFSTSIEKPPIDDDAIRFNAGINAFDGSRAKSPKSTFSSPVRFPTILDWSVPRLTRIFAWANLTGYDVSMPDVTQILNAIEHGDPSASDKLLPLVYEELRVLARQRLANEKPGQTLQATALVHEAYLRLVGKDNEQSWDNRGHFFAAAAEAMRRILIDAARSKKMPKHGGDRARIELCEEIIGSKSDPESLIVLDDALSKLEKSDLKAAEIFKLRFFAGLSVEDSAKALDFSRADAYRHWTFARAWLANQFSEVTNS